MAVTITLMRIGSVTVTSLQAFASGLLNRKEDSYGSRNTYGRLAVQQASLYELEETIVLWERSRIQNISQESNTIHYSSTTFVIT